MNLPTEWASALRDAGRVVKRTLPDGSSAELIEKTYTARDFDPEARTLTVLASDESEDRYGDVIDVSGWDVKNYSSNPVVLIDHDYSVASIVGTATPEITERGLFATITLDSPDENPTAALVSSRLAAGSLRAVSVGFRPKRVDLIRDGDDEWTGGFRFRESELLEVSFVAIPANPNATVQPSKAAPALVRRESTERKIDMDEKRIEEMQTTIEALKAEVAEKNEQNGVEVKGVKDWIDQVERKFDTLRRAGRSSSDRLRDAIPERYASTIDQHAAHGADDPVKRAAFDSWFKNAAKMQLPRYNGEFARCAEENARIADAMSVVQRATLNENTATEGGNLVPSIVEAEILRLIADNGIVRSLSRGLTMTTKTHTIPKPTSVTAYVVAEMGTNITQGEPTINNITLTAKDYVAYGEATYDVLGDSVIGIADLFMSLAAEAFGAKEDQLGLEGTAGDPFTGLVAASGVNEIAVGGGTSTEIPTYTQMIQSVYKAGKRVTRRGAAFVLAPLAWANILGQVSASLPVFGVPGLSTMLSPPNGMTPDGNIGPFPVYCSEQIKTDRTVGTSDGSNAYFGPFGAYNFVADRTGIDFLVSEHYKFQSGVVAMRMIKRTAQVVGVPEAFTKITEIETS